jgi:hypothetical protein
MKTYDKQTWSQIRAKGHARFIMRQIVRRGIPMGVIVTLGVILIHVLTHDAPTPGNLAIVFICFGIGSGYLGGEREWKRCERIYGEI